jgi:hypothetical protein
MRTIFHQLHMQVSKYCNGAFANTRIFKSGRDELSAVGDRGNAPSVLQKRSLALEPAGKILAT